MPNNVYLVLGGLSIVTVTGWLWWVIEGGRRKISASAIVLGLLVVLTFGGLLYYNLTFVQHQGRYLFPALIPLGLMFTLGLDQWLDKVRAIVVKVTAKSKRDLTPWLDEAQLLALALVFLYLARLCVVALQNYIIPNLSA